VKGRDLAHTVQRAGRLLPRQVRRESAELIIAETSLGHPRLERMVNAEVVQKASTRVLDYLDGVDVVENRAQRRLSVARSIVLNVMLVSGAVAGWAIVAGYL